MADKRMLNRQVVETDEFLALSPKAQMLYLHLNMNADDEGFVGNASAVMAMVGVDEEVMNELVYTGYILRASKTVIVITHWFVNNYIAKDRFHPTYHTAAKQNVELDGKLYYPRGRML